MNWTQKFWKDKIICIFEVKNEFLKNFLTVELLDFTIILTRSTWNNWPTRQIWQIYFVSHNVCICFLCNIFFRLLISTVNKVRFVFTGYQGSALGSRSHGIDFSKFWDWDLFFKIIGLKLGSIFKILGSGFIFQNHEIGIGIDFSKFWYWDSFFLNLELGLGFLCRPLVDTIFDQILLNEIPF